MTPLDGLGLQNKNCLLKFTSGGNLISDIRLPLWAFIKIIWESLCMIGQDQNDHLDMVLQSIQKYHGARFRNLLLLMLKVGIRLTWSNLTICNIWLSFYFLFGFLWFSELSNELGNVFKHSIPCYHGKVWSVWKHFKHSIPCYHGKVTFPSFNKK